jgi:HicB family
MVAKRKAGKSGNLATKARQILAFAEERTQHAANWVELHNALFGLGGKATELLATESERTAFSQTAECKRVFALLDRLPQPEVKDFGQLLATANGAISVRLPRSVHAALLAEARAEGVSLNQLCLSKLVAQLRAVV